MSYSHCISSILSDSVCVFCRSISFVRQFCTFFAFSVVLSLAYVTFLYLSLDVVFSLHFVNSHRLCLLFLAFFVFPTSVLSLLCFFLSLFLLLTSLLYICLSPLFSHCISSILSVLACFLCNSISLLHQYFRFFVLSVVPSLSNVTSLHLSLDVVFPLHFVNSLRLCLPFLSFFCPSYVSSFLSLSFLVVVSPS